MEGNHLMIIKNYVVRNQYYDSVVLMQLAQRIGKLSGVDRVSSGMGTPLNKEALEDMGLLAENGRESGPDDLVFAVSAEDEPSTDAAFETFKRMLADQGKGYQKKPMTLDEAIEINPSLNLAVISVPGAYAADEAKAALKQGLNVFMFSDHVPESDEVELKNMAEKKDLILMGPGCGLASINGVAIGLCSKVRKGPVGIVAASGSGMHEVMTLLHRYGSGVSHAIGTGSNDLSEAVGGITMIRGIRTLEADPQTNVIVLISKPPAPRTVQHVLDAVKACSKPVVINFIQGDTQKISATGAYPAETFEETAQISLDLSESGTRSSHSMKDETVDETLVMHERDAFSKEQQYVRGLYCGGTLAEETLYILKKKLNELYTNIPLKSFSQCPSPKTSCKHTILDMGDEYFTQGRPHVAIDPSIRVERFRKEARDPETAVIMLDFLLGHAMHEDPAGMMADVIKEEKKEAEKSGRHLCVIASICGTDLDPQNDQMQKRKLESVGVYVRRSNASAARLAAAILSGRRSL